MKLYEYISSRGGTSVVKTRMNYVRLYIPDSMKQIFNVKKSYIEVLYNRPYLGDMFGDDHTPNETTDADMKDLHLDYLPFLSKITHSIPFYW